VDNPVFLLCTHNAREEQANGVQKAQNLSESSEKLVFLFQEQFLRKQDQCGYKL